MSSLKKTGPSFTRVWIIQAWISLQAAPRLILAGAKKCQVIALALAAIAALSFAVYWSAPWVAASLNLRAETNELGAAVALGRPAPTQRQWELALQKGARELSCVREALNRPGFEGAIFLSKQCRLQAQTWMLTLLIQSPTQSSASESESLPERDAEAKDLQGNSDESEKIEASRDQALVLALGKKLRQGMRVEQAAREALKELQEQIKQEKNAQAKLDDLLEARRDIKQKEQRDKSYEGELESATAIKAVVRSLLEANEIQVPNDKLRSALAPAALWTDGWARTLIGSAAQSKEIVERAREDGVAELVGIGISVIIISCLMRLGVLLYKNHVKVGVRNFQRKAIAATQERRLKLLPAWEVKQMQKLAKPGQKRRNGSRL